MAEETERGVIEKVVNLLDLLSLHGDIQSITSHLPKVRQNEIRAIIRKIHPMDITV